MIINGRVYAGSFRDIAEARRHFTTLYPRRLEGETLPDSVHDTRPEIVLGNEGKHIVFSVLNHMCEPIFYVIRGPGSFMWDRTFETLPHAIAFATLEAEEYDQS